MRGENGFPKLWRNIPLADFLLRSIPACIRTRLTDACQVSILTKKVLDASGNSGQSVDMTLAFAGTLELIEDTSSVEESTRRMSVALTGEECRMVTGWPHRGWNRGCIAGHVLRRVVKGAMSSVLPSWASSSQMRLITMRLRFAITGVVVACVNAGSPKHEWRLPFFLATRDRLR